MIKKMSRVFYHHFLNFCSIVLFGLFLLFSIWFSSFGFISGFIGLSILIIGLSISIGLKQKRILISILIIWPVINLLFISNTIDSYDLKRISYFENICNHGDLTFNEKCNIYALNILMSVFALPVYPEVSLESFLLIFPTKNGYRRFNNGFFLKSKKINDAIIADNANDTIYINWKLKDYSLGMNEARYALALNPCRIIKKRIGTNEIFEAKVRVEYPMKTEVTLLKYPMALKIEEGLFGYLQKSGWLHPYDAIWIGKWSK